MDEATPNLDTSDTAAPSPTSADLTDTSEVATTSQVQKNGIKHIKQKAREFKV